VEKVIEKTKDEENVIVIEKEKEKVIPKGTCCCWFCGHPMLWNGDFDFSDYDIEGDGIVATLSCQQCGSTAEFYTAMVDEPLN